MGWWGERSEIVWGEGVCVSRMKADNGEIATGRRQYIRTCSYIMHWSL